LLLLGICLALFLRSRPPHLAENRPSYDYEIAWAHEIKPHRRTVPLQGVTSGFNSLRLTLTVSPKGEVLGAAASGNAETLKFWPQLQDEVRHWKFTPFEENGKAVTAEVEEYLDLVPPERLPEKHVAAPAIGPDSQLTIKLRRMGCFGACPSYTVTISTDGLVFDGEGFVVAAGKHTDKVDADGVRKLAARFIAPELCTQPASRTVAALG
jgi:hypothetical protein